MVSLADCLNYIYPNIDITDESGCTIADYGNGVYIAQWNDPRPQPTLAEIEAAYLPAAKAQKIKGFKIACTKQIQSGFTSNALSSNYTYDSELPQDQTNLLGARMAGIDMYFTCTDSAGNKTQLFHTKEQIAKVYIDGMIHIQSTKGKFYNKKTQIEQATTIDEVNAVVW